MTEQEAGPDVELDRVGAGLDRRRERLDAVLRRDRRRAAMADHERPAVAPADDHADAGGRGSLRVDRHRT